jgi:hypothetical protein
MTRAQKVTIVGLVLLLLLFVLVTVRGARQPGDCGGPERCADRYEPSSLTTTAGRWLSPLAPRVALERKRFVGPVSFAVPPADKPFRVLKLRLAQGAAARVVYTDLASAGDSPLREQTLDLRAGGDKREGSLTATRGGGTATLQCVGSCTVEVP